MDEISDKIKQQIPRLVGKEVKELIRKNINNCDEKALEFAGKKVETEIEKILGFSSSIVSLENKSSFNYRISGTEKILASILKGENVSYAVKNHIGVSVELNIPF